MTGARWSDYKGKITCLAGEVNTGKTRWLVKVLEAALAAGEETLILDMAPHRVKKVGGKLDPPDNPKAAYLTAPLAAPRLSGKTPGEVWELARRNKELLDGLFRKAAAPAGRALFINDASMYLQAGEVQDLWAFLSRFPSVVLNGYYGGSLAGGDLGRREKQGMNALLKACGRVLRPAG